MHPKDGSQRLAPVAHRFTDTQATKAGAYATEGWL